jgi:hypothetical protein
LNIYLFLYIYMYRNMYVHSKIISREKGTPS